jgi:lipopolysaccharide export system permease protein
MTFYWRDMRGRTDFFLDVKRSKIWYRSNNIIYNLENYDGANKTIHGLGVYTFNDNFDLIEVVKAEKAGFAEDKWMLENGTVTIFIDTDLYPLTKKFKTKELLIEEKPRDFVEIEREVEGLRLKEMHAYIEKTRKTGANVRGMEVQFHYRVSLSFLPMVMGLLAIPFSVGRRREGSVAKDLGICLLVTFLYWLTYNLSMTLGKNGTITPWISAWIPSVIFMGLALFLIFRRKA